MPETVDQLSKWIGGNVGRLRSQQGYSLDELSAKSGVSRSMISLVERAESSPTAAVLDKLARAFGVTLASLFNEPGNDSSPSGSPVSRPYDRIPWRDPGSGYIRCNISPAVPQPMQIVEVHFPARARVTFEPGSPDLRIYQQVWVLEGVIDITVGKKRHHLREGDCLAMELDAPTIISNPSRRSTRYAIVVASQPRPRK